MQERKNIQLRYKAYVLLKREAALYMHQNQLKQQKEEMIDGVMYVTYLRGEEACTIWRDTKQRRIEQCRHVKK